MLKLFDSKNFILKRPDMLERLKSTFRKNHEASSESPKNGDLQKLEKNLADELCNTKKFVDGFGEYLKVKSGLDLKNLNEAGVMKALEDLQDYLKLYPACNSKDLVDLVNIMLKSKNQNMITIDDGPNLHTEELMATLEKAGVRAIFYLRGDRVKTYPELVKKMVKAGHILGYHTMEHRKGDYYSPEVLTKDFEQFREAVKNALGYEYPVTFLRVPYGRDFSYTSYNQFMKEKNSTFAGTAYLGRGKGTQRCDNWDVQDNKFRNGRWEIKDITAKASYYSDQYRNHNNQVFLLHQQDDDVTALQEMLR